MFKYQHIVSQFTDKKAIGLLNGEVILQPKLDGSNCQMWMEDGELIVTSRQRILSSASDNQNCYKTLVKQEKYLNFFRCYPNIKLIGEWLILHKIQYEDSAYNKFYVFDGMFLNTLYEDDNGSGGGDYVPYDYLQEKLSQFDIESVPCELCPELCPNLEIGDTHLFQLETARYLLKEEASGGEGVVLKNYDYKNPYGKSIWVKVINKEAYRQKQRIYVQKEYAQSDIEFVRNNLDEHFLDKCYNKMNEESEFLRTHIGEYIKLCKNDFFEDYITEDSNIQNHNHINSMIAKTALKYLEDNQLV